MNVNRVLSEILPVALSSRRTPNKLRIIHIYRYIIVFETDVLLRVLVSIDDNSVPIRWRFIVFCSCSIYV